MFSLKKNAATSFRKSLLRSIFVVHILVFTMLLVTNIYIQHETLKKNALTDSRHALNYLDAQFSQLFSNALNIKNTLYQSDDIQTFLCTSRSDTLDDQLLQFSVQRQLHTLLNTYADLDSMTLYSKTSGSFSMDSNYHLKLPADEDTLPVQIPEDFAPGIRPFWGGIYHKKDIFPIKSAANINGDVVSLLLVLPLRYTDTPYAVLSLNLSLNYFDFFISPNTARGSVLYLYDDSGKRLLSSSDQPLPESKTGYGRLISERSDDTGYFSHSAAGSRYIVCYHRISEAGMYLIEEIPYSIFTQNLTHMILQTSFLFCAASLIIILLCLLVINYLFHSLNAITDRIQLISQNNLHEKLTATRYLELNIFVSKLNSLMERITALIAQHEKNEREKRELEIEILQSQINPHFLYNSLSTIRWMASMARAQNVCQAILSLTNVLRPVYAHSGIFWTLQDEQTFLENYMAIMNYRFGGNIRCTYRIPEHLASVSVLRFLLQPVVENAISHGLHGKPGSLIEITAAADEDVLLITVRDNGIGIPQDQLKELQDRISCSAPPAYQDTLSAHGFGLYNINRRIRLQYGEDYGIQIASFPNEGTTVTVSCPMCR